MYYEHLQNIQDIMNKFLAILLIAIPMLIVTSTEKYKILFTIYMFCLGVIFYLLKITFHKFEFKKWMVYNLSVIPSFFLFNWLYYKNFSKLYEDYFFLLSFLALTISLIRIKKIEQ